MSLLELKNVSKRYDSHLALDGVNIKVEEGEILALVGPNGAGKTSLLKIMAAIEQPTSGEVYFKGSKVVNGEHLRRKSTLVFQRTVLFNTNVYENVAYGLKLRGCSKDEVERKVIEALGMVGLRGYEKRRAKQLSVGEQQRVSLARALALDIELLLLDEPTANLDPKNVAIVEGVISQLKQKGGLTIVLTTHSILQAENLTDRTALLIDGSISDVGSTSEVFRQPSPSMKSFVKFENIFRGESQVAEGGTAIISIGGGVNVEAVTSKSGGVTFFVRPEDIILSKQPILSSARNVFEGMVMEASDLGSIVRLKVDVGREFAVIITRNSFDSMHLNIGSEVFITFKASSILVLQ